MELIISEKQPTVCLNMIVKNESHIIRETLEMLCNKIKFSYWVISDTGSTDNTREIIQGFFNEKKIPGELHNHEWKDFAHNRTLAINEAFGKTDLLFVFDADDEIHGNFRIPDIVDADAYLLQFGSSLGVAYSRILLVNNKIRWEYKSVLHEYINCLKPDPKIASLIGDYYVVSGRRGSRNFDPNKYLKDAMILEEAHGKALKDNDELYLRYAFYCANSYRDCGRAEDAIKWYKITLTQNNWEQEKYNCCLYIYNCLKQLSREEEGFYYLVESFKYDTERIECLHILVEHYLNKKMYNVAYNYYRNCRLFYENNYLKSQLFTTVKLFIENEKYNIYFPFNMILLADKTKDYPEATVTIAKMFEIIFTKKYIQGIPEIYIGNTLYNLQYFIDVCIKEIPNFLNLFQHYIIFLLENKFNLSKYSHFMDIYLKYGIKYQQVTNIVKTTSNEKYKTSNKILFYAGFSFVEWNYSYSMNNALGGSETAVAFLASMFPKNYEIYVAGTVKEEKIDNVTYVNLNTLNEMINNKVIFNTVIVSRYLGFYEMFNKALFYKSYIWAHDVDLNSYGTNKTVKDILTEWSDRINGCICQTKWHSELYLNKYPQLSKKLIIINNGILTQLFSHVNTKKPNRFLYTSCTDRGLNRLLELWPNILQHLPDAELIVSGYNPFPHNELEVELKQIMDKYPNSVKHVGKLNRSELYNLMSTSEYWLYPTNWPETSCITALEMLANEVICLYYPIAGLVDTMNNQGKQIFHDNEIATLLSLTPDEKTELRKNGKEYALSCSWDNRAKLWRQQIMDKKLWIFYYDNNFEIRLSIEYLLNMNNSEYIVEVTNNKEYILSKWPDRLTFVCVLFDNDIINHLTNCEISILNTEPLNITARLNTFMSYSKYMSNYQIYDYSKSNIKILKATGFTNNIEYLPYIVDAKEKQQLENLYKNIKKVYDFGLVYNWIDKKGTQTLPITPPRRNRVLEWLVNNGYTINIIAGFDEIRDIEMAKCRVILNIHGQLNENPYPPDDERTQIFEHMRCDRLLESGFQILAEESYELDEEYIRKYPNLKIIKYDDFFKVSTYERIFSMSPHTINETITDKRETGKREAEKYCFIHNCNLPNIGIDKLEEHVALLNSSGLIKDLKNVFINNIGVPIDTNYYKKYSSKYIITNYSSDTELYEMPTINKMKLFSELNPNCYILYLHSKGISYDKNSLRYKNVNDWNKMMTYFLVEKHSICIEKLSEGYDIVGCNYLPETTAYLSHFSGNFWWAQTNYLKTIDKLDDTRRSKPEAEFWPFYKNPKHFEIYSSNIEHYYRDYSRELYCDKPILNLSTNTNVDVNNSLCFVISNNTYISRDKNLVYIKKYVDNIQRIYNNSFIIICNNETTDSEHLSNVKNMLLDYKNIVILNNDTNYKCQIGNYAFSIKWLFDNNMLNHSYYVFTESKFILEKSFDFNILQNKDLKVSRFFLWFESMNNENINNILQTIDIHNKKVLINLCEYCNFIIRNDSVNKLYDYIQKCLSKIPYEKKLYEILFGCILDEIQITDYRINGVRFEDNYWYNNGYFLKHSE